MDDIKKILNHYSDIETQERLAETYFSLKSDKDTPEKEPLHAKESPRLYVAKKAAFFAVLLLFLGLLSAAFYTRTLSIDINVTRKVTLPYRNFLETEAVNLYGDALRKEEYVILTAAGKTKTAVAFDLKEPLDLSNKYLLVSAMSKKGGGRINVTLRDSHYRAYVAEILDIGDAEEGWQNFIVSARSFKESVDIRSIKHIRLNLDNSAAGKILSPGPEIYVRRVSLIDN